MTPARFQERVKDDALIYASSIYSSVAPRATYACSGFQLRSGGFEIGDSVPCFYDFLLVFSYDVRKSS
jgi:hypothetical protein